MSQQWDTQTYYEILEVDPSAQESEIRRAYLRAKAIYSQDNPALLSIFNPEEKAQLLSLIEEAYAVLCNQSTRRAYDQSLERRERNQGSADLSEEFIRQSTFQQGSDELPNFDLPADSPAETPPPQSLRLEPTPRPSGSSVEEVPPGYQRTALSVYPVDADMEAQIEAQADIDGTFLKRVRLYKKIELDDLCEHTRVGRGYLMALEDDDYENLPAPVFVRGFVMQVARALGLDHQKAVSSYMQNLKNAKSK